MEKSAKDAYDVVQSIPGGGFYCIDNEIEDIEIFADI